MDLGEVAALGGFFFFLQRIGVWSLLEIQKEKLEAGSRHWCCYLEFRVEIGLDLGYAAALACGLNCNFLK